MYMHNFRFLCVVTANIKTLILIAYPFSLCFCLLVNFIAPNS
jgi:hypothetical protein